MLLRVHALAAFLLSLSALNAQKTAPEEPPAAPAALPGRGLSQHDFFYAGEQKQHWMFIVRGGQIAWSYKDLASRGEISDAVLLPNGNILFAHQFGITLLAPNRQILWHFDAPAGTEIHTVQPIGADHVLYLQNGDPALCRVMRMSTGAIEREFKLPVGNPKSVHGHFRRARLTPAGTLLVAHMDMGRVAEYDSTGQEIWFYATESPWSAERLANGNTLICTNKKLVVEVTPDKRVVWQITPADAPGYRISGFQTASRLPNGNTLVNNWVNMWSLKIDPATAEVQALEFTPYKQIVWALRSWHDPADLGPATTIQLLDPAAPPVALHFGDIR